MWISNVSSTMIVVTLVAQMLKQIPVGTDYGRVLILGSQPVGIWWNGRPLSSPQNAVAIESVAKVTGELT
jgi:hypothetical protein